MSEIDGDKEVQISSDEVSAIKSKDISNITISGEHLCFLVNSEHIQEAFCYNVSSLEVIKRIRGNYKRFIVNDDNWILFKNKEDKFIIECYDFCKEDHVFVKKLDKNDLYEDLYPVLNNGIIYFITKDKEIYYLQIEDENIDHLSLNVQDLHDLKQLCLGNSYLRFFAIDSNNNYKLCSYSLNNKKFIIESLGGRLPFYYIKAMGELLFIYNIIDRGEMLVYNTTNSLGGYLGEAEIIKGFTGAGEHLEDFIPIETKNNKFILFSVIDSRIIKFKLFSFKDNIFKEIIQKPRESGAKFIYSNGKIFVYTKSPGEIICIKLSK